jgi:F-type H+-transporting ATPase subunit delta
MKNTRVARRYAAALMSFAGSDKNVDALAKDLELIGNTLAASRELQLLVASPVVRPEKKGEIFTALFGKKIGKPAKAFLDLLVEKQREQHLGAIIEQFNAMRDETMGVVNVHVTSAADLSSAQEKSLQKELGRITGKDVRLSTAVNASIRAGLLVRVGDTVFDASLRRQLEILRERFLTGGTVTQ